MNRNMIIGVLLVVIGILLLANVGGRQELEFGPIRMTVEDPDDARLRQVGGVIALAGGIGVLLWNNRGRGRRR